MVHATHREVVSFECTVTCVVSLRAAAAAAAAAEFFGRWFCRSCCVFVRQLFYLDNAPRHELFSRFDAVPSL